VHDKVPSTLHEVLEEIFNKMEEKRQNLHCENCNSDDNNEAVNTACHFLARRNLSNVCHN
jgi:hypothetical protein